MNILHLTPDFSYVDGRSYYVYLLLKYLNRNGHEVILFTDKGDSYERIHHSGIKVIQSHSYTNKTSFFKSVNVLAGLTEEYNIDIIHSHHRYFELMANSAAKLSRKKVKTVFTSLSIVNRRYCVEYKSDKIIAVSNCVKEMLINKFNIKPDRIVLIPNFVDSEELTNQNYDNNEGIVRNPGRTNILSIGRFHKDKDHLTLLKAVKKVSENKKVSLTLIGEGEEQKTYENFITSNSLEVKILPPQNHLGIYFKQSDICVLSSIRDPFPGFMLQSGLYKKPFIGSYTDGIPELIHENENGLLFKKKNYNELASKIDFLINNKIVSDNLAENLNNKVMNNYTEKQIIPAIEVLYEQLLS